MKQGELIGRYLFIGMCSGAAIYVVGNGIHCGSNDCAAWFGDAGYFGTLINLGTLIAIVVAGYVALQTYRQGRHGALSTRYQTGIEMLCRPTLATQRAGVAVLVEVAREAEDQFLVSVIKAFEGAIIDRSREVVAQMTIDPMAEWSPIDSAQPLLGLASLGYEVRWPSRAAFDGEVQAFSPVLSGQQISAIDFRRIRFTRCMFKNVTFIGCNFDSCRIDGEVWTYIRFVGCNLAGATVTLTAAAGNSARLQIDSDCNTTASALNNTAMRPGDYAL